MRFLENRQWRFALFLSAAYGAAAIGYFLVSAGAGPDRISGLAFAAVTVAFIFLVLLFARQTQAKRDKLIAGLFAASREAIVVVERRTRMIVDCNPAAEALYGWSRTEFIGQSTLIYWSDREGWEAFPARYSAALDAGGVVEVRVIVRHRDGRTFPSRHTMTAFDSDGTSYLAIYTTDVSVQEENERQLAQQRWALTERVKELACLYRVSEILAETEIPLAERLQRVADAMRPGWQFPEHAQVRIDVRGDAVETPAFGPGVARQSAEIPVTGPGTVRLTVAYGAAFPDADEGPFLKEERALIDDIARRVALAVERDDAEQARRRTEARLRFLTESLPIRIVVTDWETGAFLYTNAIARQQYGIGKDGDPRAHNVHAFYADPAERLRFRAALDRDGSVKGYVLRTQYGGTPRWTSVDAEIIEFEGRRAIFAAILDITEQRKAEEALRRVERLETIGQLTGGIAHDFNNLLTAIVIQLDLLEADAAAEGRPADDAIAYMRRAAQRGGELIQRLMSFARRQELKPTLIDVAPLLDGLKSFLQRMLGHQVDVAVARAGAAAPIRIDRGQMENALLNLAINARDAMPGGGTITLTSAPHRVTEAEARHGPLPAGDYALIAVADTGAGMSEAVLDRAFEPFFTTKDVGHGTGLGLSMVYGFVKQSGGHVAIESAPGKGTTVRLFFPAAPADAKPKEDVQWPASC